MVDVVPAGSWASYQDPPTRKRFRRSSSGKDVVRTRQLDGQRRRWESNPLQAALQAAAVPSGSSAKLSSVFARSRTWSSTFAGSRANPPHYEDDCCSVPRRGIEPRLAVPKTALLSGTPAGLALSVSRPGVEPGSGPSEGPMRSLAPSRHSASRPGVEPAPGP